MVEDIFIILFGLLSIECMDEYEKEKKATRWLWKVLY